MSEKDMHPQQPLQLYVVYDHPSDFPDHYVVRRMLIKDGETAFDQKYFFQSDNLDTIRHHLVFELGLVRMERDVNDDPVILETYV